MLSSLPTSLQLLLSPLLLLLSPDIHQELLINPQSRSQTFTLRHEHAVANDSRILFTNANRRQTQLFTSSDPHFHSLKVSDIETHRPKSFSEFNSARTGHFTDADLWFQETIPAPRVDDRETLLTLAKMTNNAYYQPDEKGWYDLGSGWSNNVRVHSWLSRYDGSCMT